MKPVLSPEEVSALLQGLSQYEPDHKIPESGQAQEWLDSGELREKKATLPVAVRVGWTCDKNLTLFYSFDQCNGNDTNNPSW